MSGLIDDVSKFITDGEPWHIVVVVVVVLILLWIMNPGKTEGKWTAKGRSLRGRKGSTESGEAQPGNIISNFFRSLGAKKGELNEGLMGAAAPPTGAGSTVTGATGGGRTKGSKGAKGKGSKVAYRYLPSGQEDIIGEYGGYLLVVTLVILFLCMRNKKKVVEGQPMDAAARAVLDDADPVQISAQQAADADASIYEDEEGALTTAGWELEARQQQEDADAAVADAGQAEYDSRAVAGRRFIMDAVGLGGGHVYREPTKAVDEKGKQMCKGMGLAIHKSFAAYAAHAVVDKVQDKKVADSISMMVSIWKKLCHE